jgi:phosphoglycolate phosphatase
VKRGLIFDLDGTLVNSLQGIADSLNRALGQFQLPTHAHEAVRGFIGDGSRILIERAAPTGTPARQIDEIEAAFKADYALTWPSGTFTYPGIHELLEHLQSAEYPLAVLSNKPHPFTTAMLAQLFPKTRFSCILGQRPGIAHKPDPSGALEISHEMGIPPENLSIIGDSTIDIETAKNAGMQAIAVTWGFHDRDRLLAAGAERSVDHPAELRALFEISGTLPPTPSTCP